MDISSIKEAGLTEAEAKVYLALLEIGITTTGPIQEKSGVSRSILYQILNQLIEKGLASYIIKDKTKYFQASEPNKILEYIEERKSKLEQSKDKVAELLPQLLLLKKSAPESSVQIYEGFRGVQTAFEHLYLKLKKGEEYYCLGICPIQADKYHLYWKRDHVRRVKLGIKVKLLFNQGTDPSILKNRNSYKGCDARYLPVKITTPAWIQIYKNTSLIVLQSGEMAIEIVNQEITDSFKAYFENFWKKSKRFK